MGGLFSKKRKTSLVCVGLDNSGKSTIINYLKPQKEKQLDMQATVGFQAEQFSWGSTAFTTFDMSGQGRYRNLWEYYYKDVHGIIFVIDSADTVRMCVVKDELEMLLQHDAIKAKPIPILFYANKIDLPTAVPPSEIARVLELDKICHPFNIIGSNALTGQGVDNGLKWLHEKLP